MCKKDLLNVFGAIIVLESFLIYHMIKKKFERLEDVF